MVGILSPIPQPNQMQGDSNGMRAVTPIAATPALLGSSTTAETVSSNGALSSTGTESQENTDDEPENASTDKPSDDKDSSWGTVRNIAIAAAVGAAAVPVAGLAAGACVPWAMSTFGTVIAGVGTIHAPMSAWGLAATLQYTAATFATTSAAATGASVAAVGAATGGKIRSGMAMAASATAHGAGLVASAVTNAALGAVAAAKPTAAQT
ncbi:Aste57867_18666 [Aphanomyces stellatus]|uniref:Aste57867_18666 protein n=1 Tax=Aphanomyces stellatus TaxID=120398 RepID=A0A485LEI9_9STRA|nr:hypothetical protein As57867_018604 [Aphanomyces stellatus]VFT95401.1 Aste57867_18666 [Aphanomyces stellatus]